MRSTQVHRHATLGLVALLVGLAAASASAGASAPPAASSSASATKSKPPKDGWPDTPAGARARGWVEAFGAGEKEMRAWLEENMSSSELTKRDVPKRVENYRKLKERYGVLVLASVEKSSQVEVKASLMASDASVHKFVFTVDKAAPHKLISVGIVQQGHGHGGHFGGGH